MEPEREIHGMSKQITADPRRQALPHGLDIECLISLQS